MNTVTDIFNSSTLSAPSISTSAYNDSFYPETVLLPRFSGATSIVVVVIMATAAVLITFGNALVFLAFVVDEKLRTQSNLYLLSLALCDFWVGVVSVPFYIPYMKYGTWMLGKALCKFWMIVDYTACVASVFNIVVISYDRYHSVTNPVAHRAQQEKICNSIAKIVALWLLAFMIYGPALIFWETITGESHLPSNQCFAEFTYSWYYIVCLLNCNFLIPFFSVSYFNLSIYWNIRKRTKNRHITVSKMQLQPKNEGKETFLSFIRLHMLSLKEKVTCSSSVSKESAINKCTGNALSVQKMDEIISDVNNGNISSPVDEPKTPSQNSALKLSKDKKIAKSLALLVCIFGICQAPYTLFIIISSISQSNSDSFWSFIIGWCMWSNSLINPVLYPLCHSSFRRAFCKIFHLK
ncbi:histamine H3 receptor-like [Protopterus annectens]|uniref:histamine H3 receptor-like n=1 Tax=Protopterus annectens TaxID=7888 RepID=UPI001CF9E207|nr:histamine H3 receptor-like [Protopterus annectens]